MKATVILAVAVLLIVAFALVRRSQQRRALENDLQQGMVELADAAVRLAAEQHVALDYSVESVEQVERLLGALHDRHAKAPLPLQERRDLAVRYGEYIGEVIRRKWSGQWSRDHAVGGEGSFPIRWRTHDSFPIGWCFKRILNGPEDNVWYKLQVLSRDAPNDPPADFPAAGEKGH